MANSYIEFKGADLLISAFKDNPKKIVRAAQISITGALSSASTKISRDIVRQHRLKQSFTKSRVFTNIKEMKGTVWIGGYSVKSKDLGVNKRSGKGIRAGRYFFKGGFLATMSSGHQGAFKRKKVGTRWTKGRPRTSSPNLSIEELSVNLTKIERIVQRQQLSANNVLQKIFAREMAE